MNSGAVDFSPCKNPLLHVSDGACHSLSQLIINAGQKYAFKVWLSSFPSLRNGHWLLLTSAISSVNKRSRAKAITTTENTKCVN